MMYKNLKIFKYSCNKLYDETYKIYNTNYQKQILIYKNNKINILTVVCWSISNNMLFIK